MRPAVLNAGFMLLMTQLVTTNLDELSRGSYTGSRRRSDSMTTRPRMMVVDDDRDTAEMLMAYFEAQGYEVVIAAWGQDAVRLAQQESVPDLVLLDIRLPDIDGYEVCKQLRSHRRTQN